jgi:hypothetical protein
MTLSHQPQGTRREFLYSVSALALTQAVKRVHHPR